MSMLEAGFFASADPQGDGQIDWQVYGSDGAIVGEASAPPWRYKPCTLNCAPDFGWTLTALWQL